MYICIYTYLICESNYRIQISTSRDMWCLQLRNLCFPTEIRGTAPGVMSGAPSPNNFEVSTPGEFPEKFVAGNGKAPFFLTGRSDSWNYLGITLW